jgi:(E)-4-hydroxy-3-methylbut-2-enyl-diphosphate synthase
MRRIAAEVERGLALIPAEITVAVMGCMVNGPGEAKEADVGVACGRGAGVLFRGGKLLRRVSEKKIVSELLKEAEKIAAERQGSDRE